MLGKHHLADDFIIVHIGPQRRHADDDINDDVALTCGNVVVVMSMGRQRHTKQPNTTTTSPHIAALCG